MDFLRASSGAYDSGFPGEAKRMAVSLRVLLYDSKTSVSLLAQLKVKDRWMFTDTAEPVNPVNLAPTQGLVFMKMTWGESGEYVAPLDNLSPGRIKPPANFAGWWNNLVMVLPSAGERWCRREFVLELAHKEGGAHVDPTLTQRYEDLTRRNSLGWQMVQGESADPFRGNPVYASVRQCTHEVLTTFDRESQT